MKRSVGQAMWRRLKDLLPWLAIPLVVTAIIWGVDVPPEPTTRPLAKGQPKIPNAPHWYAGHVRDVRRCGYCRDQARRKAGR